MSFRNFIREYFTFNRRERNGVFVLLVIILLLLFYLSFAGLFYAEEQTDFSQFEKDIAEFEAEQKRWSDSASERRNEFYFSGNIPAEERKQLHDELIRVEINSADTTELKRIKGIGSVFAARIVKFRQALGGFVSKEQLLGVYGMDKEKFAGINSQITVNSALVKKLNINTASAEDLSIHPYISKKEAVAIFTKRVRSGDYASVDEVKTVALMPDSVFEKAAPYLTVE